MSPMYNWSTLLSEDELVRDQGALFPYRSCTTCPSDTASDCDVATVVTLFLSPNLPTSRTPPSSNMFSDPNSAGLDQVTLQPIQAAFAAHRRRLDQVRHLLDPLGQHIVRQEMRGPDGSPTLHWAVYRLHPDKVREALGESATVDVVDIADGPLREIMREGESKEDAPLSDGGEFSSTPHMLDSNSELQMPQIDISSAPTNSYDASAVPSLASSYVLLSEPETEYDGSDEAEFLSEPDSGPDWDAGGGLPRLEFSGVWLGAREVTAN